MLTFYEIRISVAASLGSILGG